RPGDRLYADAGVRVRFEAGRRVPGSPASGIAWAAGPKPDWVRSAGVLVTVLFAAIGLVGPGRRRRLHRPVVAFVGAGALAALLWSEATAIYALLDAPDLFLGGVTPARLLLWLMPGKSDHPVPSALRILALAGAGSSFLASAVALRERLGAWRPVGSGFV